MTMLELVLPMPQFILHCSYFLMDIAVGRISPEKKSSMCSPQTFTDDSKQTVLQPPNALQDPCILGVSQKKKTTTVMNRQEEASGKDFL